MPFAIDVLQEKMYSTGTVEKKTDVGYSKAVQEVDKLQSVAVIGAA
ncbi:hypothetical protein [Sphingobacterium sp. LRF_L2]